MPDIFDQIAPTQKGDIFDEVASGAVQNLNATATNANDGQPHMRALTPWERYAGPVIHAVKQAIEGPDVQPAVGIKGVLPTAAQVLYGTTKPDVSGGVGVMNFSPGTLMPQPTSEVEGINKGILDQVNVQNLLLLKGLGGLLGQTGRAANLLKAGTAAYLTAQGAEQAGQQAGQRFSGTQTEGQKGEGDVNMVLSALQAAGSPFIATPERAAGSVVNALPDEAFAAGPRFQLTFPRNRFEVGPQGDIFDKLQPDTFKNESKQPKEIESQKQVQTVQPAGEPGKEPPQGASNVQGEVRQGTFAGRLLRKAQPEQRYGENVIPANVSYTDPRTGFTVEGYTPDSTAESAVPALQKKIRHDLVPAINMESGVIKATADDQLSHDDVLKANKIEPASVPHEDPRRGFVDSMGNWYTRKEAEEVTGLKGTAKAGGLDSMDLPRASYEKGAEKENWKAAQLAYEKAYGTQLYSGSGPLFDPELLGISPERAAALKEKYLKRLAAKGKSIASDIAQSPKQFAPKSARAAAILGSTTARPMEKTQELIAQPGEKLGVGERAGNLARRIAQVVGEAYKVVNPWDVLYDWMDGGKAKYNGPLMENIRKPLDSDFNDELNLRSQLLEPIRDLIKKNKMGKTQSQRIGVYLNTLQSGGRERMISSGIDPNVIAKIEKTITPQEKAVAQSIRQMYDSTFPLIQKVAKDVDGIDLNPIDNYFSWEREWRKYKPEADELATPNVPKNNPTVDDVLWPGIDAVRTRVKPGSIEKRVPGAATPIKIDAFEIVDRYVRDASHYIAMRRHLKEISEIVRSDEFASKYGQMGQDLVMEHLNTIARQGRYKRNGFLDGLRKLTSRGVVAFRLPSQFVHLANIPLGMQRAGVARWYKGLDEALSDEGQAFLKKNFAETFERGGGEPALREVAEGNLGKMSAYHRVSQAGFWLQRKIDQLNAQATVIGVYMRELEKKGKNPVDYAELPIDKAAVEQARVEARRAVASPLYKDVPPLLNRGGSLTKSLMQFQNTFLDQWSNIQYDLAQVGVPEAIKGNPKLAMQMTAALAAMLMVETGVKYGYKQGLAKATGTKQRDSDTFENTLEHEALRRIPGMGQLQSQIVYGETGVPSIDALEEPIKQGVRYAKATDKSTKTLAATRAGGAALEVAGVPGASQATDIASAVERKQLFKSHTERLKEQEGKDVERMSLKERYAAEAKYKKTAPPMSKEEQASAAERSIANIAKRGEEVSKELDKSTQNWIASRGLTVPGYDNKLKIGKENIYLDDNELQRLHGYIKDEYMAAITDLRTKQAKFDKMPADEQKIYFNESLLAARTRARFKLMQELSRSKSEPDKGKGKQKKFSIFNND